MTDEKNAASVSQASEENTKNKSKSWIKRLAIAGGIIVVLLVALIYALPGMLSAGWGTGMLISRVNDSIRGSITFDDLSLSWFGQQQIEGLRIFDHADNEIVHMEQATLDTGLLALINGSMNLKQSSFQGITGELIANEDGEVNLFMALTSLDREAEDDADADEPDTDVPTGQIALPENLAGQVAVRGVNLKFVTAAYDPVMLRVSEMVIDLTETGVDFSIDAEAEQSGERGTLTARGQLDLGPDRTVDHWTQINGQINATADRFPLQPIDVLVSGGKGLVQAFADDRINLSMDVAMTDGKPRFDVQADSQTVNLDMDGSFEAGVLTLNTSGRNAVQIQPQAITLLQGNTPADQQVRLMDTVTFTLNTTDLRIDTQNLGASRGEMSIAPSDGTISVMTAGQRERIAWQAQPITINMPRLAERLTVNFTSSLSAPTLASGQSASIDIQAELTDLLNGDDVFNESFGADITATLENFPTAIADALVEMDWQLAERVGPTVQASVTAKRQANQTMPIDVTVDSRNVEMRGSFVLDADMVLHSEQLVSATVRAAHGWLSPWFNSDSDEPMPFTPTESGDIVVMIESLRLPLNLSIAEMARQSAIDLSIQSGQWKFAGNNPMQLNYLSQLQINIQKQRDTPANLSMNSTWRFAFNELWSILGDTAQLNIEPTEIRFDEHDGAMSIATRLPIRLIGSYNGGQKFIDAAADAVVEHNDLRRVTDASVAVPQITKGHPLFLILAERARVDAVSAQDMKLTLEPIPFENFQPTKIAGDLTMARLSITDTQADDSTQQFTLTDQSARFDYDMKSSQARITMDGQLAAKLGQQPASAGQLDVKADIASVNQITSAFAGDDAIGEAALPRMNVSVQAHALPTALLAPFLPKALDASRDLGPTAMIDATLDWPGGPLKTQTGQMPITVRTEHLKAELPLRLADGMVQTLNQKPTIRWALQDETFASLMTPAPTQERPNPTAPMLLNQDQTSITLNIDALGLPLDALLGDTQAAAEQATLDVSFSMPKTELRDPTNDMIITLNKISGSVSAEGQRDTRLNLEVLGEPIARENVQEDDAAQQPIQPRWLITGTASPLPQLLGGGDIQGQMDMNIRQLPSRLVDAFVSPPDEPYVRATFGEMANEIDGKLTWLREEKSLRFRLNADNAQSKLNIALQDPRATQEPDESFTETGIEGVDRLLAFLMRLEDDSVTEVGVNPLLSQVILKHINPMLVQAVSSNKPIRLTLSKQGFAVPIAENSPYTELKYAQIRQATVELNTLTLNNGGMVRSMFNLLQRFGGFQGNPQELAVQFTPLRAKLLDGVASYERTDFLISDSYHLATWGKINQVSGDVDMSLALTAWTLRNAFGLSSVRDGEALVIPMKGNINQSSFQQMVQWDAVIGQIASLIGEEKGIRQLREQLRDNPLAAALAEAALKEALKNMRKDLRQDVPPPTVDKFPWADRIKAPTNNTPETTRQQPSNTPDSPETSETQQDTQQQPQQEREQSDEERTIRQLIDLFD